MEKTKFYDLSQNNSGGSFDVNETLCHRLFIEADTYEEAVSKAESLGCYWNGVDEGQDCPCCGDRWYKPYSEINLMSMDNKKDGGYPIETFLPKGMSLEDFKRGYKGMEWIEELVLGEKYGSPYVTGRVKLRNVEDYAQVMANLFGWTSPDVRVFYKNGEVKEIFSSKIEDTSKKKSRK